MRVCKYCGCEYCGEEDRYEAIEGSLAVQVIAPSWVINLKESTFPINGITVYSLCDCPCHWRGKYNKEAYIQAYKEIYGEAKQ